MTNGKMIPISSTNWLSHREKLRYLQYNSTKYKYLEKPGIHFQRPQINCKILCVDDVQFTLEKKHVVLTENITVSFHKGHVEQWRFFLNIYCFVLVEYVYFPFSRI